MAGGLVGLLDDIASLARMAAASIDDVGAAAGRTSVKAAGIVIDDAAVTPTYVQHLAADRELPIISRIAKGSLRNKLLFILPAVLALSAIAPVLVEAILMCGGAFLAYEGAHKVLHALRHDDGGHVPAAAAGGATESSLVAGAIRTDFVLSAEIMVLSLKEVLGEPFAMRAAVLVVVAVLVTAAVYGVVALIVKMDDVGLRLVQRDRPLPRRVGRALVRGMPRLLGVLSVVGTAAMLWVGGHILLAGSDELGWHGPYGLVHDLEHAVEGLAVVGGVVAWVVGTAVAAAVGFMVGALLVTVVERLPRRGRTGHHDHAEAPHAS